MDTTNSRAEKSAVGQSGELEAAVESYHNAGGYGMRLHSAGVRLHSADEFFGAFAGFIKKQYGPRCNVVVGGCPCCSMWALYDLAATMVVEDDDGDSHGKMVRCNDEDTQGANSTA